MNKYILLVLFVVIVGLSMGLTSVNLAIALISLGLLALFGFICFLEHKEQPDIEAEMHRLSEVHSKDLLKAVSELNTEISQVKGRLGTIDMAKHSSSTSSEPFKF